MIPYPADDAVDPSQALPVATIGLIVVNAQPNRVDGLRLYHQT